MSIKSIGTWIGGAVLALAVAVLSAASAGNDERARVVGDMNVYLGVMAVDAIRAQPTVLYEEQMHGGIPKGENVYHVLVSLLDRGTGDRIEDATVTAKVAPLGLGGSTRTMEVMYSSGVICYCNWFEMTPGEHYHVSVLIERPGEAVQRTHFLFTPD